VEAGKPVYLRGSGRVVGKKAVVVTGWVSRRMTGSRKRVEIGDGVAAAGLEDLGVVAVEVRKRRRTVVVVVTVLAVTVRKGRSLAVAVEEGSCVGDRWGCRRNRLLTLAEGLLPQEDTPCFEVFLQRVLFAAASTDR